MITELDKDWRVVYRKVWRSILQKTSKVIGPHMTYRPENDDQDLHQKSLPASHGHRESDCFAVSRNLASLSILPLFVTLCITRTPNWDHICVVIMHTTGSHHFQAIQQDSGIHIFERNSDICWYYHFKLMIVDVNDLTQYRNGSLKNRINWMHLMSNNIFTEHGEEKIILFVAIDVHDCVMKTSISEIEDSIVFRSRTIKLRQTHIRKSEHLQAVIQQRRRTIFVFLRREILNRLQNYLFKWPCSVQIRESWW